MARMYFEDFEIGETKRYGEYTVTEDEMVDFAEQYDPQPLHLDQESSAESIYDNRIASGWLTTAIWGRLFVNGFLGDRARMMGALGIDALRWRRPRRF